MGQLQMRMEADLKVAGYSPGTRRWYLSLAKGFAAHFMRSPAELGADEIRQYLLWLVEERRLSPESIRAARSALRFLYRVTLNQPVKIDWLPVPRKPKRLPVVLSGSEVAALLDAVRAVKYRAVLMAMYAGGLRISEACRLRPECIDARRGVLRIRGKGNKERLTVLSERLLAYLRRYWRQARPSGGWLFPGRTAAGHVSPETTSEVFRKAVATAGITKVVTPHVLRHSFATHLIDAGTDVSVVQALLGHESLRVTEVYLHTSIERIARTPSPLDLLGTPQGRLLG